jgi:peptide/nickel transport system substrate-binding protein
VARAEKDLGRGGTSGDASRCQRPGVLGRRGFLGGVSGLLGFVAAELRSRPAGAQTTRKTDLVVGQSGDFARFDPHMTTGVLDSGATFNIFDNLVNRQRDNQLHPSLAREWKLLQPTVWQFRLRPGVKWHNGDSFSSVDVKFSIERTSDTTARTVVATVFSTVDRVEVPDSLSVLFHTKKPDLLLPARLASFGGQIIPKKYFESVGPEQFNTMPVGTGPVKFVSWRKDDQAVFEAYRDYWGGRPDFDKLIFRPIPEPAARLAALLAGEVDIILRLPPDHVEQVLKHPRTKVESVLYAGHLVLAVNSKRPPLDNPLLKQALSLAIDRETIIRELRHNRGIVPNGPIPQGDNHYDASLPPLRYDPALAKRRIKEASYNREEIVLEATVSDKAMSETVVGSWQDVGINAKLEIVEASVRGQKLRERTFKGLLWGEPASALGDPDGMMWRLLAPGASFDLWRHPRFDELGEAAHYSVDERFRGQAYKEMTQIFLEHLPWIPVIQHGHLYGLQRYVEWKPYSNQLIEFRPFNFKFRRP